MTHHPLFAGFKIGILANLDGKQSPENLTPPQRQMEPNHLAACYQISRQLLAHHSAKLGLAPTDWLNPDLVFGAMLEKSKACRLRSNLANPSTRRAIQSKLEFITKLS